MRLSHQHIRALLSRRNSFTGRLYASDPTVMAWELANEPRPMNKGAAAFREWIGETAAMLRSLAPHQLLSLGSEGATPLPAAYAVAATTTSTTTTFTFCLRMHHLSRRRR